MKIGFKGLLTILSRRYGDDLVKSELAKWDGRRVDNFKTYFSKVCKEEFDRQQSKKLSERIERESQQRKMQDQVMATHTKDILSKILIKDIWKETKVSDGKLRLDKKTKCLLESFRNDKNTMR